MDVTFTRTAERRPAVSVERPGRPRTVMSPAPGYHPYLPHDLAHFTRHWPAHQQRRCA